MQKNKDVTLLPHVIVTGNPGEGFTLYGPFDNFIAALNFADANSIDAEWWSMPVFDPKEL